MDLSPTQSPSNQTATAAAQASATPEISSDFETFLRMLTVQMQNQDPLNPVDSSDYAVQLATFSSVEQQVHTNDLLRALQGQMGTGGIAQMADWIGKEARTAAAVAVNGAPVTLYPEVTTGADSAQIIVRDAAGQDVDRLTIPTDGAAVDWAGVTSDGYPFPSGQYSFETVSYAGEEVIGSAPAATYSTVKEIQRGLEGDAIVILEGGAAIDAAAVTALRNADA